MLPQQRTQTEQRPRVMMPGSPHLIVPPRTDTAEMSFEEYESYLPSAEDLLPYGPDHPEVKEPQIYWDPISPNSYIKPFPQVGMIHSQNGKIICLCKAEEDAWRAKLAPDCGDNPDRWKGHTADGGYTFECETCHFATTNAVAYTDHVRYWKHR